MYIEHTVIKALNSTNVIQPTIKTHIYYNFSDKYSELPLVKRTPLQNGHLSKTDTTVGPRCVCYFTR